MKKLWVTLLIFMLAGCADPFSGRDSETPTADRGTFVQPVSPQIVLFNLDNAYRELIITNFIQCLDTNFIFHYDFVTKDIQNNDSGWAYDEEVRLSQSFFSGFQNDSASSLKVAMLMLPNQVDQAYEASAVLYRSYTLRVIHRHTDGTADTTEYLGTSIFTMVEDAQGFWSIRRWEDQHQNIITPSWADYKNGYR